MTDGRILDSRGCSAPPFLFVFLPIVFLLYFALPGVRARNALLLVASLFFYAWGFPLVHGIDDSAHPKAVVFRDSFANDLIPYLSEHFDRVVYLWSRDLKNEIILAEKTDIVIQEIAGRFLLRQPKPIKESKTTQ